ncbi:hypothetical protein BGX34_002380 [Mortierella sp. NVP85]|nr:hypothetical protein BGX34_002380 [Mortierella sp. NVP85]
MTTVEEAYISHVGNVLDLLVQEKDLDPVSQSFNSPNPLPLEFVDASTPQYIQKVDASLQRTVQKMFMMEQELARYRKYIKSMPVNSLITDIVLAPPILTPPVDSLSPPVSASSRWTEGNWEFINHTATHSSTPNHPPRESEGPASTLASSKLALALAAHSIESTEQNGQASRGQALLAPTLSAPISAPVFRSPTTINTSTAVSALTTATAPATPTGSVPCSECIQKCTLIASSVVRGDLRVRIECHNTACHQSALIISINEMMAKLSRFTGEVIRVAAQGVEGKLGVQAKLEGERGTWKEFITLLNTMTDGHSKQVRDIASVCTSVAHGDLSRKITVDVKGETLILKNTINKMGEWKNN